MNDTIFALEKREKQILGFIESKRESIEKNPNSFFDKLELQSLESHYSDVYQQLTIARAEAQKELIEMRLLRSCFVIRLYKKIHFFKKIKKREK